MCGPQDIFSTLSFTLLHNDPAAHQDHCTVGYAGFEPGTSVPDAFCASDEPLHLQKEICS